MSVGVAMVQAPDWTGMGMLLGSLGNVAVIGLMMLAMTRVAVTYSTISILPPPARMMSPTLAALKTEAEAETVT